MTPSGWKIVLIIKLLGNKDFVNVEKHNNKDDDNNRKTSIIVKIHHSNRKWEMYLTSQIEKFLSKCHCGLALAGLLGFCEGADFLIGDWLKVLLGV